MYTIYQDYIDFKTNIISNGFPLNFVNIKEGYQLFSVDRTILWTTNVISEEDRLDFETYYKSKCNKCIYDANGKKFHRAESRPLNTNTCFTGIGDSESNIGDGKEFSWDFSNETDEIIAPEGFRRKRIEFKFLDNVWIKEGTIYFYDMPQGSYGDMYIVAPTGTYYYDNNNEIQLAEEDTKITHYVIHHKMEDSVPMGDELNTECCSDEIPNAYKFWIEITIPDIEGTTARGNFDIELYRQRNIIL